MKKTVAVITLALSAMLIAGCGEANQDASKGNRNTESADIINMPEFFRNVAHKCDGPNMVYVTSYGGQSTVSTSIAVVANDPRCKVMTPQGTIGNGK